MTSCFTLPSRLSHDEELKPGIMNHQINPFSLKLLFFLPFFFEKVSLCKNSDCLGICLVDQADLKCAEIGLLGLRHVPPPPEL